MRLIDADLIQYEPMLSAKGNGMYEDVMVAYKSQIDDLPTIEKCKTGKWVGWHAWICSECGERNNSATHFCPNCGARMEI